ncbi:P-loop containing nucleoside triphosphate hydrolase protein [Trametopsis cervina]|nr:P-loop containing nucleoside triphosphate hydrolase protein [Trametopsis cervina]
MADGYDLHDPLSINLLQQTRLLVAQLPSNSSQLSQLQNVSSRVELFNRLSRLLATPGFTILVATLFRPLLLDLCARWLADEESRQEKLEACALLLEVHPEIFPVLSQLLLSPNFSLGPLGFLQDEQSLASVEATKLHQLLLAYYRLLHANNELPRIYGWPLSLLSRIIWECHPDTGVRFLAIRCYALQSGMVEGERVKMENDAIGKMEEVECPISWDSDVYGNREVVDGWIIPIKETERVFQAQQALLLPQKYYMYEEGDSVEPIHPAELSPLIVNVHGVLMLRSSTQSPTPSPLVSTPTTTSALRDLAVHLSLNIPTLLTSPPSSGKSLLLTHLAAAIHPDRTNQVVTIHLADTSLDPRSLLGSYVSSPTRPGTFEWKEGVLVKAMREGRWVVFEDIDRGSNEVLGLVKPLVESLTLGKWVGGRARMEVPSRGLVLAAQGFSIFATRSIQSGRNDKFPSPTFFGAHKFHEVIVPSPTQDDLQTIVDVRFPRLAGPAGKCLIRLWDAVRQLGFTASTRDIGVRELEKLCLRIDKLLPSSYQPMDIDHDSAFPPSLSSLFPNPTIREDMLSECRDVFFGAGATTTAARIHFSAISSTVAEHLGLSVERRDWVLQERVPEYSEDKDINGVLTSLSLGRTRLFASATKPGATLPTARSFAMHKPAKMLLSSIASSVSLQEPILLTGETGTGKTSIVSHLASLLRKPLISLNLSNQTEASDIVGGFKPVDARVPAIELHERFSEMFGRTFSRKKNAHFEESVRKAVQEGKWKRAVALWSESARLAKERIQARLLEDSKLSVESDLPRKRRKTENGTLDDSEKSWTDFEQDVRTFEIQHVQGNGKFAFAFVEGPLVKALRLGHWILLDEVNLASAETLECISALLHGPTASITLTEQGSLEPVPRHPDFRLFACMNPATDVGKKDLPPNIRSRFTELDVPPPDADKDTLLSIVTHYIGHYAVGDRGAIMDVTEFYSGVRTLSERREIADGSNHRPHFSMRTLARALTFAADLSRTYSLRRALWEGCLMAFTMALDGPSASKVTALAQRHILAGVKNPRSLLAKEPLPPHGRPVDDYIKFGPFYLERGSLPEDPADDYIITPSVETKLVDLARIIVTRRFPVLIEGPTSSGKTSSIEYLAKRTGHRFVRINNHEHTDIQEYLGTYVSDSRTGKLVFKDGLLVRALRHGDWIVLDELNLAPTDVLEALNRLLDDNRELVIPETQEVVKPHPSFMLFATQNPPGLYGGRKVLSRAFRNRFLEVHYEEVPQAELETILCQRCRIAPSYGQRIVAVFQELQKRRQSNRIFESKHGFATLRDLFRWAGRDAMDYQELADNGYMLLAERARREEDKKVVKEVIESIMKVSIDPIRLYALQDLPVDLLAYLGVSMSESSSLVWTSAMKRLFTLVARALRFNEPVLLVGETGSGKTSVFQAFAEITGKKLHAVNCHQNTETADLIGSLRPLRNRTALESEAVTEAIQLLQSLGHPLGDATDVTTATTAVDRFLRSTPSTSSHHHALMQASYKLHRLTALFDWHDGPLIQAMRSGDVFLMDEISLADDSVLERLNSVLEPARTIVLAEQGGTEDIPAVRADDGFKLVATMNPGGDYGKKELSPALRNRFTEVWVPAVDTRQDLDLIVRHTWRYNELHDSTSPLLDFVEWLSARVADRSIVTLRDILAWVGFVNVTYEPGRSNASFRNAIFHHAAQMTFLDGLGTLPQLSSYSNVALEELKRDATARLDILFPLPRPYDDVIVTDDSSKVQLGSFSISRGPLPPAPSPFSFQAPTTRSNVNRVLRACQLPKPILLEGSPGVGKTSLVAALANVAGHQLCRINLSDQTDLVDLFGSDLPVEGGSPGQFAWKDADFLRALQEGHWVLLDEMNLAPQAVLEGLNAVLDHRGTVYIPELGRSFMRHPSFRIFAAQNPLHQGGGRKGLPKSFLNRFTKVHVRELSQEDTIVICRSVFPTMPMDILQGMVNFTAQLNEEAMTKKSFARAGAPWEFNLRDILRWGSLAQGSAHSQLQPEVLIDMLFLQRFRTPTDRTFARELFERFVPNVAAATSMNPSIVVSPGSVRIGGALNIRQGYLSGNRPPQLLHQHLPALQALATCIANGWLAILTGERSKGKKSVVRFMANITGNSLQEIFINSATDAADILGSYEEVDPRARAMSTLSTALDSLKLLSASLEGSRLTTMVYLMDALYTSLSNDAQPSLDKLLKLASQIKATLDVHTIPSNDLKLALDALGSATQGTSRFEWVDGPLIRALKAGHWVLLDGANLCNPSVLDRLNSLCESNGFLTLNEKGAVHGTVETIKPHPNFRLFMTVDSHFGELSRAMRNRGVEIALTDTVNPHDSEIIADYLRLPRQQPFAMTDPRQAVRDAEYLKRGLQVTENLAAVSSSALSTKLLAEDSGSSAVLDLTQTLQTFESTIRGSQNADTYVAAYCIAPSQLPLFRRLICSFSDPNTRWINILATMNNLELCAVRTIVQTQKDSSHLTGLTDGIILSQSLDLEIYPEIWSFDTSSATSRQLLRLIAASSTFPTTEIQVLRAGEQSKAEQNAREILLALVQNIQSSAVKTYEEVQMTAIDAEETLAFATRLLSFASYLLRVGAEDRLDYSALYATSRWLLESFREPRAGFRSVEMHVQALHGVVALTSGRGLSEIWSSLSSYLVQDVQTSKIAELDDIARNLPSKLSSLRSRIFDLMTLITLTWTKSLPNEESINAIAEQLRSQLPDMWSLNARDTQKESADPMHLLTELNLIAGLNVVQGVPLPQTFRRGVEELLDIVIQDPEHSLSRFTSFRHVLWLDETTQLSVASIFAIYRQWLRSIWSTSLHEIQGPSILQAPTMLRSTALHCDRTDQDMIRLSHREEALRRHVRMIALSSATYHPRDRQLGTILLQMLIMVVSCFHDAISDADSSELQQVSSTLQDVPFESSFSKIIDILQRVNHQGLRSAVAQCLQSSTRPLGHLGHPSYEKLGEYWVELAQLLLILFVPSSPIDPASLEKSSTDFWAEQKAQLAAQISLLTDFAKRTQGNVTNGAIRSLAGLASEVSTGLATSDHVPVARTDLRRLHTYWAEVHQFISQVVSPTRLQPFLEAAQSGEATASMRETVIQGSIGAFCQRLDTVYPDFLDINFPLQAALYAMRLGLRLMTVPSSPGPSGPAPSTSVGAVNTLIVSPSILSAELWLEQHQEEGSSASFSTILAQLTGISFLLTLGGELEQHIPRIALLYEQAYGLWSIDHVRAEDKEREAQSLYRNQRGQDNLTDAELEEQDFLALFPEFEDLLDDGVASLELPPIKKAELVTGSSMSSLMQIRRGATIHRGWLVGDGFDRVLVCSRCV